MNSIKENLIIFDLGWTLEDESDSQLDRAKKVSDYCIANNMIIDADKIIEYQDEGGEKGVSNVFNYSLTKIGLDIEKIEQVRKIAKWESSYLKLYPDTKQTIKSLYEKFDLGIIANQSKSADYRLKNYDIFQYFKFVISSCDVGYSKPDDRIFKIAMERINGFYKDIWMIGDRIDNDIVPAKKLGLKTIRIMKGSHRMQKPINDSETPDYNIDNLNDLIGLKL
jgi:HAD superfamily hydrolase (TIGR01549 family)